MTLLQIGNYTSLVLATMVLFRCVLTCLYVRRSEINRELKVLLCIMLAALFANSLMFCVLSIEWIGLRQEVLRAGYTLNRFTTYGWMLNNILNGIAHLAFLSAVQIYLQWKTPGNSFDMPYRRRTEDQP